METTLGVPAHRGGVLVRHPGATTSLLGAVSRTSGLDVDLLVRRPPDRRTALERQRDVRERRGDTPVGDTPVTDGLRVGWLDGDRVRPAHPVAWSSGSGDREVGPHHRARYRLPPVFDEVRLVIAWPTLDIPDTEVTLSLPGRDAVARGTTPVWDAPALATPAADGFGADSFGERPGAAPRPGADEPGRVVAARRVLHRADHAVLVLDRLAVLGPDLLSLDLDCLARGDVAREVTAAFPPGPDDRGPRVAVLHGGVARAGHALSGSSSSGGDVPTCAREFVLERHGDVVDLLVAWPAAGLGPARARIPLDLA
ncbi:hypothetical protein [Saccharothrix longispora]|uniref:hypothetical protein n=1 Tax=Saccharothrix longispora TaxID=33920 RepID=UPI0028FD1D94|nr:hypothetical protein [Saccharothrix longispora]MBY8848371.1 hypothetical protein [Saccharothrix sp. MB29]MDU0293434.1 hypothetical protein [Saccharothrix longispora]